MASRSTIKTASKSKSKAKVSLIDTRNLDLATYAGRCSARVQLYVAACLQGDIKATAGVLAETGKDSMRQQRYGVGASSGQRVTLIFEGPLRQRVEESKRRMRDARSLPTAPGLAPMQLDEDLAGVDARDDARESADAPRGDNNGHAPPTSHRPPADDNTLTPSSPASGPLGGVFGEKNLEKNSAGAPPASRFAGRLSVWDPWSPTAICAVAAPMARRPVCARDQSVATA